MKCRAKTQSGRACKANAIAGATVCRVHGGSAPQVRAAAERRLAALVDPAITTLDRLVKDKKIPGVALGAAKDIMDRNGFKPVEKVEQTTTVAGVPQELIDALAKALSLDDVANRAEPDSESTAA